MPSFSTLRRNSVVRSSVGFAVILALITSFQPAASARRARVKPVPPSFSAEVLQNFDAWDSNHDGVISQDELEVVIRNPSITEEAAAAAATLKIMMRGRKFVIPPLTRDYFAAYEVYSRSHSSTTDAKVLGFTGGEFTHFAGDATVAGALASASTDYPPFANLYGSALRRVKSTRPDLFIGDDAPSLAALKQGQIGDCFFLAIVGAMLNRGSADVRKMISTNADGSYDVAFPSGKRVHVAALSEGEIALGSGSSGSGRWVAVLEAAYDALHVSTLTSESVSTFHTDSIANGGSVRIAMRSVVGLNIEKMLLRNADVHAMPEEQDVAAKLPHIRKVIGSALADHRLVCASTTWMDRPAGITPNHAFAVIGFDASSDTVTLWNPHGRNFTPSGEIGVKHGYPTTGGIFTVPVIDFARVFSTMNWQLEQDPPADSAPVPVKHIRGMG